VINPRVRSALEPDVASVASEASGYRVLTLGVLRAMHAAARQQTGEIRSADTEYLPSQNVLDTLFEVRDLGSQAFGQAPGNLTEEDSRLRAWVQEPHRPVCPYVRATVVGRPRLGQRIQHSVGEIRRRKDFVV
jgi:hypothetical protein